MQDHFKALHDLYDIGFRPEQIDRAHSALILGDEARRIEISDSETWVPWRPIRGSKTKYFLVELVIDGTPDADKWFRSSKLSEIVVWLRKNLLENR